jgi:4-hydroxybenzoate polyprenyltransferase
MAKFGLADVLSSLFNPWMIVYNITFVYIGMLLSQQTTLYAFFFITLAFMSARLAALLLNRYIGREVDLKNRKKRATEASLIVPKKMLLVSAVILSAVFVMSTYMLNTLAFALSPIVLLLFVADPMLKKHTSSRHFSVGLIESLNVLAGYIGVVGAFPVTITLYLLVAAIIFIGAGSDIIYSVTHVDFDRKEGLKTYPVKYGVSGALDISAIFHAIAACLAVTFAVASGLYPVLIGAVVASCSLALLHLDLEKADDKELARRFKLYNAGFAAILFISVVLAELPSILGTAL